MLGTSGCLGCATASDKISKLTEERNVLEAQRDHYSARFEELTKELELARQQLSEKFKISNCSPDCPSIFDSESLERLREWQKCVEFCIEERLERAERSTKSHLKGDGDGDGDAEEERRREELDLYRRGKDSKAVLPISLTNLAGFLTKNHQLTQKYTEYPEPKPKPRKP